jgi:hypothetical protein
LTDVCVRDAQRVKVVLSIQLALQYDIIDFKAVIPCPYGAITAGFHRLQVNNVVLQRNCIDNRLSGLKVCFFGLTTEMWTGKIKLRDN